MMTEMEMEEPAHKPRLQDIESQPLSTEEAQSFKERMKAQTIESRAAQGAAIASAVLAIVSWVLADGSGAFLTALAAVIAIPVAVAVFYFQLELEDEDTLRKVQNDLRHTVNDFMAANEGLTANNDKLEEELVPLKESEAKLQNIASETGISSSKLRGLVRENQATMDEMQVHLKEDILQDMMEAVLNSEHDEDGHFSDREIKKLALRLNGLPAIAVDKQKFDRRMENTRTMSSVFTLMREVTQDDIPEDDRVFTIAEDVAAAAAAE